MQYELSTVLFYLVVFMVAAKLGDLLSAKLRQPGVFGELILGILIGPSILGTALGHFGLPSIDLSSTAGDFMGILAQIGIILLLFLSGLSIDLDEFKAAEKSSLSTAAMGVIVAFSLGFGVAFICGWSNLQAGFMGAVLAATSVGITARTLGDVHALHTPAGITTLEAAVVDDVIGIVILTVLAGIAMGNLAPLGVAKTIILIALFIVVMIYLGTRLLPPFISKVGRIRVEEITLSVALVLIFLISGIAQEIGLAAITGSFLVGVAMARASVARSLNDKISTIGYGLFIPLFFVYMGASTDLEALSGVGAMALGVVGVAIIAKVIGCGVGAKLGGMSWRDSLKVGVGMMPRAEVALVVASLGVGAGIVTSEFLSITVLVVLVTGLITPVLVKWAFKETAGQS